MTSFLKKCSLNSLKCFPSGSSLLGRHAIHFTSGSSFSFIMRKPLVIQLDSSAIVYKKRPAGLQVKFISDLIASPDEFSSKDIEVPFSKVKCDQITSVCARLGLEYLSE